MRAPPPPPSALALAIVTVGAAGDSAPGSAARAVDSIAERLRSVSSRHVLSAAVRPTVDLGQLREVLNVSRMLEVRPARDGRIDVALREGDSTRVVASLNATRADAARDSIYVLAAGIVGPPDSGARGAGPEAARMHLHAADSLATAGKWDAAERTFIAAIAADPQSAHARHDYSLFLEQRRRIDEALREARRAHELDPLSADLHLSYARMLGRSGRDGDATRETHEQQRIATILNPTPKDKLARARFKNVPKRPPRASRRPGTARRG